MATLDDPNAELTFKDATAHRRRVYFRNFRGRIVVSAWPKKRGRKQAPINEAWKEKFKGVSQAIKFTDPCAANLARTWTRNSGWYYRDMLSSMMFGTFIRYHGETKIKTPTASAYCSFATNVSSVGSTILPFDTTDWDNNAFWDASDPTKLQVRAAGLYLGAFTVSLSGNANDGNLSTRLLVNGVVVFDYIISTFFDGARNEPHTFLWYFHENDVLQLEVAQSRTANDRIRQLWLVAITPETLIP